MLAPLDLITTPNVFASSYALADVWISRDRQSVADYAYGGTRLIDPDTTDQEVEQHLGRLTLYESSLKNRLIDLSLEKNVLASFTDRLPTGLVKSRIGGARCIIRPRTAEIAAVMKNPQHPEFRATIEDLFKDIGKFLNELEGEIKLTPDFGRFAGLADILAQFTPHVLGIKCEDGGCGGKSSYSSTGVIAALETLGYAEHKDTPVTLIGAAGAMGSDMLNYFSQAGYTDLAICDLVYDNDHLHPGSLEHPWQLPSAKRMFTDACLQRGGLIVATTIGQELENSNWQIIPSGTTLLLAHNLAIPEGEPGIALMQNIAQRGILAIPGQALTLGGALTSRLEWFWRQTHPGQSFDKPLAHAVVRALISSLISDTYNLAQTMNITPYEVILHMANREWKQ